MRHRNLLATFLMTPVVLIVPFAVPSLVQAAMITVVNLDGPNEGFNDPTLAIPVGGNSGTTLGAQRLIAFQAAANLWGTRLTSSVEILVGANFDPLSCTATSAILGAAGPDSVHRDFIGAPVANTWYPQALANSLAGSDLAPGTNDIGAVFNSSIGTTCPFPRVWYYGLDANPPSGQNDFFTVVLHELGHGLGFLPFVDLPTGAKLSGFNDTYMLNLENHSTGKLYPDMSNAERFAVSTNTSNLHWVGPNVVAASGFLTNGRHPTGHVEMFAPNPQQPGSSVSHFSNTLFPNELMEPVYTGPNHNVELTLELFADIGWTPPWSFPDDSIWTPLPIGGRTPSGPTAAIYNDEPNLVVRGMDNRIYHSQYSGTRWTAWRNLGGATPSEPAAVEFNGDLWVFVRGMNNRLYRNRLTGQTWSGWSEVPGGGLTPSGPAATAFNNTLYLFVRGMNNRLYQNRFNGATWTGWSEVPGGGSTPSGPAAVVFESTLYLAVQGTNNRIYDKLFTLTGWTSWAEVPGSGQTPSAPAATVFNGELWYFVRGLNDRIYHNRLTAGANGTWSGWREVPGNGLTPSRPGAAATVDRLHLLMRGTNNQIYLNQASLGG